MQRHTTGVFPLCTVYMLSLVLSDSILDLLSKLPDDSPDHMRQLQSVVSAAPFMADQGSTAGSGLLFNSAPGSRVMSRNTSLAHSGE